MLRPLYTAPEMRRAEEAYPGYPETVPELMERAGAAVAERALERFPDARRATVVCGAGSNGGDGRVAARLLEAAGLGVRVVDVKPEDEAKDLGEPELMVDAIFGTGFEGEPRPGVARLIEQLNAHDAPVVAVDVPSGVNASTGEVAGPAVDASLTVTFHGPKVGLLVAPGLFHAGEVVVADIGLEPVPTEHALVDEAILRLVPRKTARDTKYSAGAVLVVGGAPGLTGAACLVAEAAFRADAGYVAVSVPADSLRVVETKLLEPVKLTWDDLDDAIAKADAVALGPGMGRTPEARDLVRRLLELLDRPVVVDADGLFGLEPFERQAPTVLTPHAGELGRLLGEDSAWVDAHRLEAVRRAAARFDCVVLLKGADTIVAAPGRGVLVCGLGTPALATAGTGDVLTGVLAAFLAKGLEPALAAAAAAAAGGVAASLVDPQRGVVASDVVAHLPRALG